MRTSVNLCLKLHWMKNEDAANITRQLTRRTLRPTCCGPYCLTFTDDYFAFLLVSRMPSWLHVPTPATIRHVLYGIIIGFSLSMTTTSLALYYQSRKKERLTANFEPRPIELRSDEILSGVTGLIGILLLWLHPLCSDLDGREHTSYSNQLSQ